ncbi:hypothetical protein ACFLYL_03465 [Chloroflexota bacterium]
MEKTLVISDVTQMPQGNEVCIVGIDRNGKSERPVCHGDFQKHYLIQNHKAIIRPAAKVEFDLKVIEINPPHIEDMGFDPNSITSKGFCNNDEWGSILQQTSFNTVEEIFEGYLQNNNWILPGSNTRSIGTLSRAKIMDIELTGGSVKPRISFADSSNHEYCRPVNDLTLWNRCYSRVKRQGNDPNEVAQELVTLFQNADRIYMRLGLARPWEQDNKCWLQITGVHTFPDYLQGKTFTDF